MGLAPPSSLSRQLETVLCPGRLSRPLYPQSRASHCVLPGQPPDRLSSPSATPGPTALPWPGRHPARPRFPQPASSLFSRPLVLPLKPDPVSPLHGPIKGSLEPTAESSASSLASYAPAPRTCLVPSPLTFAKMGRSRPALPALVAGPASLSPGGRPLLLPETVPDLVSVSGQHHRHPSPVHRPGLPALASDLSRFSTPRVTSTLPGPAAEPPPPSLICHRDPPYLLLGPPHLFPVAAA